MNTRSEALGILKILGVVVVLALSLSVFWLQMLWYYIDNSYMWFVYYAWYFLCIFLVVYSLRTPKRRLSFWFVGVMAVVIGYIPYDVLPPALYETVLNPESSANNLSGIASGLPLTVMILVEVLFYPFLHFLLFLSLRKLIQKRPSVVECNTN